MLIKLIKSIFKKNIATKKVKWIRINNLEWSDNLGKLSYYDAVKRCKEIDGRLPTRGELVDLYDSEEYKKFNFIEDFYWSCVGYNHYIYGIHTNFQWCLNFKNGHQDTHFKANKYNVRCVKRSNN